MIIIGDILVSEEIVREHFMCNLSVCKGACCVEGDWGAPLSEEEKETLDNLLPKIKSFLSQDSIKLLEDKGAYYYVPEIKKHGTSLHENGACSFLVYDNSGIAMCGIEQAFDAGAIDFKKPLSCHLYPIRVSKNEETGFEAMNYDQWEICNPACEKGKKEKMPLYKFAKEAIIRAYGLEFYDELEAAAKFIKDNSQDM